VWARADLECRVQCLGPLFRVAGATGTCNGVVRTLALERLSDEREIARMAATNAFCVFCTRWLNEQTTPGAASAGACGAAIRDRLNHLSLRDLHHVVHAEGA